jgi:hypothetical protein
MENLRREIGAKKVNLALSAVSGRRRRRLKYEHKDSLGGRVLRRSHAAAAKKITYFYLFCLPVGRLARIRMQSIRRILPALKMRQKRESEINSMLSLVTSKMSISIVGMKRHTACGAG